MIFPNSGFFDHGKNPFLILNPVIFLIASGINPVQMNKIGIETVGHFATGTPAHRTSFAIPVKNGLWLVMEITLNTTIFFPNLTDLPVVIQYIIGISR